MSAPTLPREATTYPPRPAHLSPGDIDRKALARAVTFAFTSYRHASGWGNPGLVDEGGVRLAWLQGAWIDEDLDPAEFDDDTDDNANACGTGCCIAGWLDVDARGLDIAISAQRAIDGAYADETEAKGAREIAVWLLTGYTGDTLLNHRQLNQQINRLFQGDNTIDAVITQADALLDYDGQPPLKVDPSGVFS